MTLGGTDLNLLVALKVLLEEGNVTRAGKRLEMSQPAMSGALGRLRRRFDDELLIRNGRIYELTPFARELLPEVQESLRLISQALAVDEAFDPSTSDRVFRLTMSDYAIAVLHESMLRRIAESAPGVRLAIDLLGPDVRGSERVLVDYDAMIGPLGYGFFGMAKPLWRDRMVCLVDAANPRASAGALTLEDIREMPHAVASFGAANLTPADRALGELQVQRRVQVQVHGWLPLPFVIEGTGMVAIVPERLARLHAVPDGPLAMLEPPFGHVVLAEGYHFASHRLSDPAHQWLFALLDAVGAELESVPA